MAIELSIPNDLSGRTAQEKADFYSTQRMAGFSDPAIRNAVSSTIGPQADDDWNYLLQMSGYANVDPNQQRGTLPYGNSLIAALRNNTQQLPAGSMSSYTMLPNQAPAPPVAAPPPSKQPNYLNIVRPFPATGTAPTTGNRDLKAMLPFNWNTYDANRKIDWFNQIGATLQELKNAEVTQDEINWMTNVGGYRPGGAAAPLPTPAPTPAPAPRGAYVRTPEGLDVWDPNATPNTAQAPARAPAPTAAPAPAPATKLGLPADWFSNYDAGEKINWFNQNKISAEELKAAGVTDEEIKWMSRPENGYIPNPVKNNVYQIVYPEL